MDWLYLFRKLRKARQEIRLKIKNIDREIQKCWPTHRLGCPSGKCKSQPNRNLCYCIDLCDVIQMHSCDVIQMNSCDVIQMHSCDVIQMHLCYVIQEISPHLTPPEGIEEFFNEPFPVSFFLFSPFQQLTFKTCSVQNFADDWIRTADLW